MKYLCFDFGTRRIGIAASDPSGTLVRPVTTIDRKVTPKYIDEIKRILDEENPQKIIFGLPLGPDAEETPMCKKVRTFVSKIYDSLNLETPYDFQDESFSSVRTQAIMLKSSSKKRRKEKPTIDKVAACVILEDYLREQSGQISLF